MKHSGLALLLLYLSGDLELNPGSTEGSQASYSLRPRCTTCNLAVKKNVGFVTCSECKLSFHLNFIGPQFEKSRSCANCSTLFSAFCGLKATATSEFRAKFLVAQEF